METFKDIEVSGRKWRITKFDARTGSKVVKKLIPIAASLFGDTDIKKVAMSKPEDMNINFASVVFALASMTDDDFDFIQNACLRVTGEALGAGFTPTLNDNNSFGVVGLEFDTSTVLALTAHSLVFNVAGFFDGTPLASMAAGMFSSFQQNSQT